MAALTAGVARHPAAGSSTAWWRRFSAPSWSAERRPILRHPNFGHFLDQSYMLSAPGAAHQVAELSDVEAREMPFHFSAAPG